MPTAKTIGLRILELRKSKGLTQQQLASKIGVTRQLVCNYETGDCKPGDEVKKKIADFFKVDIGELFFAEK